MYYAIVAAMLLIVMFLKAGVAGDMVRVPLWNGMFSFMTPRGWRVTVTDNLLTAHAAPGPDSFSRIVFSTPNPLFRGGVDDFLRAQLSLFVDRSGGNIEHVEVDGTKVDGFDSIACSFAISDGENLFLGTAFAFDFSGCKVFVLAVAPENEYEFYEGVFSEIISSYETDDALLAAYQEQLLAAERDPQLSGAVGG